MRPHPARTGQCPAGHRQGDQAEVPARVVDPHEEAVAVMIDVILAVGDPREHQLPGVSSTGAPHPGFRRRVAAAEHHEPFPAPGPRDAEVERLVGLVEEERVLLRAEPVLPDVA